MSLRNAFSKIYLGGPFKLKSYLYRTLWEKKYKNVTLSKFNTLEEVADFIRPGAYRPDTWRSLWDAVGYPGKAQRVFEGEKVEAEFDCDDFAIWLTAVLSEGQERLGIDNVTHTSIFWGSYGHAVCTFVKDNCWYLMDYGPPVGPFSTRADIAEYIARICGKGAKPWLIARHDLNLTLKDFIGF